VLFTAAMPFAIGLFDRHCDANTLLHVPPLYRSSQRSENFTTTVFWLWFFNAVYHSIVFFWLPYGMLHHDIAFVDGKVGNYLFVGNMVYTYVVVAVCIKGGLETSAWTWLTHLAIWGSIACWFIFLAVYSHVWPTVDLAPEMVGMDRYVFSCPSFWFGLFLIPSVVLLSDVTFKAFQRTLCRDSRRGAPDAELSPLSCRSELYENPRWSRSYTEESMSSAPVSNHSLEESTDPYMNLPHGFAFSQEEQGVVEQSDLIRQYNSTYSKPTGL
jgi:phospholipid-transporting ATPase